MKLFYVFSNGDLSNIEEEEENVDEDFMIGVSTKENIENLKKLVKFIQDRRLYITKNL